MSKRRTFKIFSLLLFFTLYLGVLIVSGFDQKRVQKLEIGVNPPKLKLELQLFKTQYLLREPIWVRCKVTNVGTEPGRFYFENLDALVLKDSKGTVYPCEVHIDRVPITIKPGQTLEKEGNLLVLYGVPENKFKIHRYLPPEIYSIYYELNQAVESDKHRVSAKSQIDSFTILEPKREEVKVMNLLRESFDLFIEKKYNECISKLDQIVQQYPNSNYAPYALSQKVMLYQIGAIGDANETLNSYSEMLNTYPNSREAVEVLSSLVYYYKTKPDLPGLINYLNNLLEKHPDSEVAKQSQKELAKLKEQK